MQQWMNQLFKKLTTEIVREREIHAKKGVTDVRQWVDYLKN